MVTNDIVQSASGVEYLVNTWLPQVQDQLLYLTIDLLRKELNIPLLAFSARGGRKKPEEHFGNEPDTSIAFSFAASNACHLGRWEQSNIAYTIKNLVSSILSLHMALFLNL